MYLELKYPIAYHNTKLGPGGDQIILQSNALSIKEDVCTELEI